MRGWIANGRPAGQLSISTQSIDMPDNPPKGARQAWNLGMKAGLGGHVAKGDLDARGRVVRENAREDLRPEAPAPLYTNIDLDLQKYVVELFGDSLIGGVVAAVLFRRP